MSTRVPTSCGTIWRCNTHGEWYENNPTYSDRYDDTGDCKFGSMASQGIDEEQVVLGLQKLSSNSDLRSVLILRNDTIVCEVYPNGGSRFQSNNIHSAAKPILSALTGIAVGEGFISSVDQRICEIIPDCFRRYSRRDVRRNITVKHLMTMMAGLRWVEDVTEHSFRQTDDWVQGVLDQGIKTVPGRTFCYSTGAAHLLSAVITKATGGNLCAYAHERLFGPLNITPEHWGKDPQGVFSGGYNMYFTARELAKFGQLYLDGGRANGLQVVPEWFIKESLADHCRESRMYDYGYFFWNRDICGYKVHIAWGWGGQFVCLVPELDLMVVSTADTGGHDAVKEADVAAFLDRFVLPYIVEPPAPGPPDPGPPEGIDLIELATGASNIVHFRAYGGRTADEVLAAVERACSIRVEDAVVRSMNFTGFDVWEVVGSKLCR